MKHLTGLLLASTLALGACASVNVTKVDETNSASAKGVRYYLPKPVLQFVPNADGTVSVSVLYLPDASQQYAIDTNSVGSMFAYQVALGPNGLLNAVEFKRDTGTVGQQLATIAGGVAVQAFNMRQAEIVAAQTAVDTAQTALDTAKVNLDAATAKLQAAIAAGQANTNAEAIALAEMQSKYLAAQQVYDRVKSVERAVAFTATAAAPIAGTALTASTGDAFKQQPLTQPSAISMPEPYGAVLYAVDEVTKKVGGKDVPTVSLTVVKFGPLSGGVDQNAQPTFQTIDVVPPGFGKSVLTFPKSANVALHFSREILSIGAHALTTDDGKTPISIAKPTLRDDKRWIVLETAGFKAGTYELEVQYTYDVSRIGTAKASFRLN